MQDSLIQWEISKQIYCININVLVPNLSYKSLGLGVCYKLIFYHNINISDISNNVQ